MSRTTNRKAARKKAREQHIKAIVDRVGEDIVAVVKRHFHRFLRATGFDDAVNVLLKRLDHSRNMVRRAFRLLLGGEILQKQPGGYALVAI